MALEISGGSANAKVPTLRQYLKIVDVYPQQSAVVLVFPPGKYDNWSFITEAGYRVSANADSDVYSFMFSDFELLAEGGTCFAIKIVDASTSEWSLTTLDATEVGWEKFEWGWRGEEVKPTPTRKHKNSSSRKRKQGAVKPEEELEF